MSLDSPLHRLGTAGVLLGTAAALAGLFGYVAAYHRIDGQLVTRLLEHRYYIDWYLVLLRHGLIGTAVSWVLVYHFHNTLGAFIRWVRLGHF